MPHTKLILSPSNVKPHLDLEGEIQLKKDGLFTFILRVVNGNIKDLDVIDYVLVKEKYKPLFHPDFQIVLEQTK